MTADELRAASTVAAVCGPGGTGVSTACMALAQGLAASAPHSSFVLLADLRRHAEQGMLHDVGDVGPGVQELVDAQRRRLSHPADLTRFMFEIPRRNYLLLPGPPSAGDAARIGAAEFAAAFATVRSAFPFAVNDVDADWAGPGHMSRHVIAEADVVFAVGVAGMKGLHSLARVIADVRALGVLPARIVPVVNRAPRHPRVHAEVVRTLQQLTAAARLPPVVFLPERRLEAALRDVAPLPAPLPAALASALRGVVHRGIAMAAPRRADP